MTTITTIESYNKKTIYQSTKHTDFSPIGINGTGLIEEDDAKTGVLLFDVLLDEDENGIIGRLLSILKWKFNKNNYL